jgi:hypothetical protein
MMLYKTVFALLLVLFLPAVCRAEDAPRWEYKLVSLGSLTALQKDAGSGAKMGEVENILNREGLEGWELVNIFAVRTTFDPNVFFAALKRPLHGAEETSTKGDERR